MKLFFLHIEKCGGTSLRNAFARLAASADDSPTPVIDMDGKAAWDFAKAQELNPWTYRDQLLGYCLGSKHSRLVMGHFRYNDALHRDFLADWTFTLVLRDPIDRFLSHFSYNRNKPETHGQITQSIADYVATPSARHAAVSYVSMLAAREKHYAPISAADIDRACANLHDFKLIGLLEDLEGYRRRCEQVLDAPLAIPVLNTTAKRKRHEDLPPELMAQIEALCAPSVRVYEEASRLIEAAEAQPAADQP